ncbi:MAG: hypothetical protein JSR99_13630 [Proteobacteria bacterium]|nr:hypothetical protein [Pseudomonadota bacterium]
MRSLACLCLCLLTSAMLTAATGYQVNNGANQDITEFSTCKNVANAHASGKAIFVPTKTSTEWSQFYNNTPAGVTISACAGPCAGKSVGGYCWYEGASSATCTATCSSHGGTTDGTIDYTGSGGSLSNCSSVMAALGQTAVGGSGSTTGSSAGCYYSLLSGKILRSTSPVTTQAGSGGGFYRACSCVN